MEGNGSGRLTRFVFTKRMSLGLGSSPAALRGVCQEIMWLTRCSGGGNVCNLIVAWRVAAPAF
jgi:hypothetical protein